MGRRPNVVIQEYFHRGPKLTDNSNRYPQTCKLCGEVFPKGRFDSLTNHLTKRCTMITQNQRINACLALNGINASRAPRSLQSRQQQQSQHGQQQHQFPQHQAQMPLDLSQHSWALTPLETLAEVSRQQITHLNEHGEDGGQSQQHAVAGSELMSGIMPSAASGEQYHVQDQFTLNSPQSAPRQSVAPNGRGRLSSWDMAMHDLTPLTGAMETGRQNEGEAQLHTPEEPSAGSNEAPNLTMAAAAAARLSTATMMDPTLFHSLESNIVANHAAILRDDPSQATSPGDPAREGDPVPTRATSPPTAQMDVPTSLAKVARLTPEMQSPNGMSSADAARLANAEPTQAAPVPEHSSPAPENQAQAPAENSSECIQQLPWGQFTYMTTTTTPPKPVAQPMMGIPTRSVFRVDQNGTKNRHSRAKFSDSRRKEVRTIRRIGACIRCRILRKTCSQGDPCDTCRRVLTPRLWNTGCIRTKFADKLDLYGARIQVHHCNRAVQEIQRTKDTKHAEVMLEATHSDEGVTLVFETLRGMDRAEQADSAKGEGIQADFPKIVMADPRADLPQGMQIYLDQMLPELIHKEEATFSRITLELALQQLTTTGNKVLKLALDLWGYVEIIERELKWRYTVQESPDAQEKARSVTKESDPELFKTLGFQLSAAAEMKAELTSKQLLLSMGRDLQDGRIFIGLPMFCAILLLLISVEKSTWAFLTWERVPQLKEQWPLPMQPGEFTEQGDGLAELLRMLLTIRKALPKTAVREEDGVLTTDEAEYQPYFEEVNLKASDVVQRRLHPPFYATTSRSLEMRYCSTILLPEHLLPPHQAGDAPFQDAVPAPVEEDGPPVEVSYDDAQSGGAGGVDDTPPPQTAV